MVPVFLWQGVAQFWQAALYQKMPPVK